MKIQRSEPKVPQEIIERVRGLKREVHTKDEDCSVCFGGDYEGIYECTESYRNQAIDEVLKVLEGKL